MTPFWRPFGSISLGKTLSKLVACGAPRLWTGCNILNYCSYLAFDALGGNFSCTALFVIRSFELPSPSLEPSHCPFIPCLQHILVHRFACVVMPRTAVINTSRYFLFILSEQAVLHRVSLLSTRPWKWSTKCADLCMILSEDVSSNFLLLAFCKVSGVKTMHLRCVALPYFAGPRKLEQHPISWREWCDTGCWIDCFSLSAF